MAEKTNIGWADFTASPHLVCTEVDPCCANCWARELAKLKYGWVKNGRGGIIREAYRCAGFKDWDTMPIWGNKAPRVISKGFWDNVRRWNKKPWICDGCGQTFINRGPHTHRVKKEGKTVIETCPSVSFHRARIFPSMIDWLDDMPAGAVTQSGERITRLQLLTDFLRTVFECQNLTWMLLTKRPENWRKSVEEVHKASTPYSDFSMWLCDWLDAGTVRSHAQPPQNIWFGYTAGTRKTWIERYNIAKEIPAAMLWCSAEPLLEELSFKDIVQDEDCPNSHMLDLVVIGGESGPNRRDCGVDAIVNLAQQAQHCGCKVFVKQDCSARSEQQGRIPDHIWRLKQLPEHTQ